MESKFYFVHSQKENFQYDHIPLNLKGIKNPFPECTVIIKKLLFLKPNPLSMDLLVNVLFADNISQSRARSGVFIGKLCLRKQTVYMIHNQNALFVYISKSFLRLIKRFVYISRSKSFI